MQRRTILSALLGSALVTRHALTGTAWAQEAAWPTRPIKMVVPFAAGGASDVGARLIAGEISRALDQPVYIENIGGAGGTVGIRQVARARADGYTIGYGHVGTLALAPLIYPNLGYDPLKDLTLLGQIGSVENILIVLPNSPYKSVSDIIDASRRKPGGLNYGSAGVGTSNHLSGALLSTLTGIPLNHVPYKGSAPALTDLLGGNIDFMFDTRSGVGSQITSGRVRVLAHTATQRLPDYPEIPTVAETVPGYAVLGWNGLVAPEGLPPHVVRRLSDTLRKAVNSPEFARSLKELGTRVDYKDGAGLRSLIQQESARWQPIIKSFNLKPN
jgi:tripartite-type tricarboxylate transporter receptor subunit TctC